MKKRLFAIIIDSCIISFVGYIILWTTLLMLKIDKDTFIYYSQLKFVYFGILFSLKDLLFKNKSVGKKTFDLEVLTTCDKIPPKYVLFIRNLLIAIWPIELLLIIVFNKRIGDVIFKTKVCKLKI